MFNYSRCVMTLVAAISSQVLLWMCIAVSFLPSVYTREVEGIFLRDRAAFPREYDLFIFRSLIVLVVVLTIVSAVFLKKRLNDGALLKQLGGIAGIALGWSLLGLIGFVAGARPGNGWSAWAEAGAILGNALTWIFWPEVSSAIAYVQRQAGRLRHTLCEHLLLLRISGFAALVLGAWQIKRFLMLKENVPALPFFFPLAHQAVAVYTLSFIIPLLYMLVFLYSITHLKSSRSQGIMGMVLSGMGLLTFTAYVRLPIMDGFWVMALPLLPILALSVSARLKKPHLDIYSSLLSGIQIAFILPWVKEQRPWDISPPDFACAVYAIFISGTLMSFFVIRRWRIHISFAYVAAQLCLVTLMSLAWFKLIVYDYRGDLARAWFKYLGAGQIGLPFVWPALAYTGRYVRQWPMPQWIILAAIALIVYVPDIKAMTAHIFMGEYFAHTDEFLMGPLWSFVKGGIIDQDVYSRYGIGAVAVFGWLVKSTGSVSYEHLLFVVVAACTLYFMAVYLFFKAWLKDTVLALGCWLLAFKAQICFELAYPFVYTFPQASVARQLPDIVWMLLLLQFVRRRQLHWLLAASAVVGVSIWFMPSVGIYMLAAHGVIAGMAAFSQASMPRRIKDMLWPMAVAVMVAVILFAMLCGTYFFSPSFWVTAVDFMKMFLLTNTIPLLTEVRIGQWLNFGVFCFIVVVYLATIIRVGATYLNGQKTPHEDWLALALSFYGLGLLEHFVTFSIGNNYYTKTVPFFIVLFYWGNKAMMHFSGVTRRRLAAIILGAAAIALFTHHGYNSYPNVVNISPNPLLDQKVARPLPNGAPYFYHKSRFRAAAQFFDTNALGQTDEGFISEFDLHSRDALVHQYQARADFTQDARLIDALTAPSAKVPVICGNEVLMLIEADRKPFFFFFPLLSTDPLQARVLPYDFMDKQADVDRIIADLRKERPPYVFIAKLMNRSDIPPIYRQVTPGLMQVLDFIKANYVPDKEGQYLIAMKRKGA